VKIERVSSIIIRKKDNAGKVPVLIRKQARDMNITDQAPILIRHQTPDTEPNNRWLD